jgi:hypothetical protein
MDWLQSEVFQAVVRNIIKSIAVAAFTHGIITSTQQPQFVEIGVSVAVWCATMFVTYLKARQHQAVNTAIANAVPSTVPESIKTAAAPTNVIGMQKTPNGLP